MLKFRASES